MDWKMAMAHNYLWFQAPAKKKTKKKTAAFQSLDCRALPWLAKHWEIKETIGQQMLSSLVKTEWALSSSALQQKKNVVVAVAENPIKAAVYTEDVFMRRNLLSARCIVHHTRRVQEEHTFTFGDVEGFHFIHWQDMARPKCDFIWLHIVTSLHAVSDPPKTLA